MRSKQQNYFGEAVRSREMESFCVSLTSHRPNSAVRFHSHEKPYLCLLVNGLYKERSNSASAIVETGTSLYRGANHEHANHFFEGGGTCLNIEINNPDDFNEEMGFGLPEYQIPRLGTVDIYKLLYFFKHGYPDDLLNILCYESVITHFDRIPVKGKLDWVRLVKERIHDDPFTSISLAMLSNEFDLHPNYIVRKFKEVTGYRLSEYLNKVRVELSLARMIKTEESLTEIAFDMGFCDQSHFIRTFKRYLNSTPRKFRKSLKG